MPTIDYRIIKTPSGYSCQRKRWFGWEDIFCHGYSDLPVDFKTQEEAKEKIIKLHLDMTQPLNVVVEHISLPYLIKD